MSEDQSDYKIIISPRLLDALSKELYTNIYFALGELIANAYDADAKNVNIYISNEEIRVEDDGTGMSSDELKNTYLVVGKENRDSESNAKTSNLKRLKMGRKGVGKLAALSISEGFSIITKKDGDPIGLFIPKRIKTENEVLKILPKEELIFKSGFSHGTAIVMKNPIIAIPKKATTITKNLGMIFPAGMKDFSIHVFEDGKLAEVTSPVEETIKQFIGLITVGEEYSKLKDYLPISSDPNIKCEQRDSIKFTIHSMADNNGTLKDCNVEIKGWIGVYETTTGRKADLTDFSDNYLAIFSHGKMGLRNVLSIIGKNRVGESYIAGNMYIDAFEDSDFPDMASTSRQGYNESDKRWAESLNYLRKLMDDIIGFRDAHAKAEHEKEEEEKIKIQEENERVLRQKYESAIHSASEKISPYLSETSRPQAEAVVQQSVYELTDAAGFKRKTDSDKRKLIISQTKKDKSVADLVYHCLVFNGFEKSKIIYSNCDDHESMLPINMGVYDYLEKFFVNSVSDEKIFALFVLSKDIWNENEKNGEGSWGVMMEIGATWITKKDHRLFCINDFAAQKPLNVDNKWTSLKEVEIPGSADKNVVMTKNSANDFVEMIRYACEQCGYRPKDFDANMNFLKNRATIE